MPFMQIWEREERSNHGLYDLDHGLMVDFKGKIVRKSQQRFRLCSTDKYLLVFPPGLGVRLAR